MSESFQTDRLLKPPIKVGITGGIGSGKTTVCLIFESLGIPVYYADNRAKELMNSDKSLKAKITALFGSDAYLPDKGLNRSLLARLSFQNPELLQKLNAIVHPAVLKDAESWHSAQKNVPYTLKEAALLFESGSFALLDKIIVVSAPESLRIQRVMHRDGMTKSDVEARIKNQIPDEEKRGRADFVIWNDGRQLLIPQVLKVHNQLVDLFINCILY